MHDARHPLLVTMRLCDGLPSLRRQATLEPLLAAFARVAEVGEMFRVVVFSLQSNHLHLVVEAEDARSLSRGMQGLSVRIARALNRQWGRTGAVFSDRYHARALATPREVRNALVYALHNARKHGANVRGIDPFTSGRWFEGWSARLEEPSSRGARAALLRFRRAEDAASRDRAEPNARIASPGLRASTAVPVARARSWLGSEGWMRLGRIRIDESPAAWRGHVAAAPTATRVRGREFVSPPSRLRAGAFEEGDGALVA